MKICNFLKSKIISVWLIIKKSKIPFLYPYPKQTLPKIMPLNNTNANKYIRTQTHNKNNPIIKVLNC